MLLNEILPGKSIEIFVYRTGYKYRLVSKIESVAEDGFYITLIANRNHVFFFQDTDKVEILYRNNEQLWMWRGFRVKVTTLDDERVHQFILTGSPKGERFNRRNAFRVFIGEEMTMTHMIPKVVERIPEPADPDHPEESKNAEPVKEIVFEEKPVQVFLKDLSENGVGFFSNYRFEKGDELEFELQTEFGVMKQRAEVIRVTSEIQGAYLGFYGCMFTVTSRELIKYLFDLQRKKISSSKGQ